MDKPTQIGGRDIVVIYEAGRALCHQRVSERAADWAVFPAVDGGFPRWREILKTSIHSLVLAEWIRTVRLGSRLMLMRERPHGERMFHDQSEDSVCDVEIWKKCNDGLVDFRPDIHSYSSLKYMLCCMGYTQWCPLGCICDICSLLFPRNDVKLVVV